MIHIGKVGLWPSLVVLAALPLNTTGAISTASPSAGLIIRTVQLHGIPDAIAIDARLGRAFIAVTNPSPPGHAGIVVFATQSGLVSRQITLDAPPYALAVDTRGDIVFVATAHRMVALDARTGMTIWTIALPALVNPALAVDDGASRVVVTGSVPETPLDASSRGMIVVLDAGRGVRLPAVALRGSPSAVAVDARTGHAFVSVDQVNGNGYVAVVDTASSRLVRTTPIIGDPGPLAVAARAARVFVVDGGSRTGPGASVSVLDAHSGLLTGTAPTGALPWALASDERTGRVFVVNQAKRSVVSVLDAATGRLLRTVEAGENAVAVATDATTGRVFVVNGGALHTSANMNLSASVSELDAASGRLLRTIPLSAAFFPRLVAVDERAGRVLIASVPSAGLAGGAVSLLDATR